MATYAVVGHHSEETGLYQALLEVVVVPPGWWHQVILEDRVLSISAQLLGENAAKCFNHFISIHSTVFVQVLTLLGISWYSLVPKNPSKRARFLAAEHVPLVYKELELLGNLGRFSFG